MQNVDHIKRRLDAHQRTLATTRYGDVARMCLIEIAKDLAELDRVLGQGEDVLVLEDAVSNCV